MAHGGKRTGAGRKSGSGKWNEATKVVRIPESRVGDVLSFLEEGEEMLIPVFSCKVQAGFPSPADDHMEGKINLNQHLISNPAATYIVRATGNSMIEAGIFEGDEMIVDRSIAPVHGKIVVAVVDNDLTVKRLYNKGGKIKLIAENKDYSDIEVNGEQALSIWGVVTRVLHKV